MSKKPTKIRKGERMRAIIIIKAVMDIDKGTTIKELNSNIEDLLDEIKHYGKPRVFKIIPLEVKE